MNPVYNLVANVDTQITKCYDELGFIANSFPSDADLNDITRARETTLTDRVASLQTQRVNHINNFINESPALVVPSAHQQAVRECELRFIEALKGKSQADQNSCWALIDNANSNFEKIAGIYAFLNI